MSSSRGRCCAADVATAFTAAVERLGRAAAFLLCLIGLFVTALFTWLKRLAEREKGLASEVTEAYERVVEASNLKSAFLANISHEIPHADERCDRHDRAAPEQRAERRSARVR